MKLIKISFPNHPVNDKVGMICTTKEEAECFISAELEEMLDGGEPVTIQVEVVEMTAEELDSLEEFEGF